MNKGFNGFPGNAKRPPSLISGVIHIVGDYVLKPSDHGKLIYADTSTSIKITIPAYAHTPIANNFYCMVESVGAGLVYFYRQPSVTTLTENDWLGIEPVNGHCDVQKVDVNEWLIDGDLKIALDADAEAYVNAYGSYSVNEQTYINDFVLGLKSNGSLWSKCVYCHLYMGGTINAMKYNVKNPVDTDAGFRITLVGSPTVDANGVTGNGTTQYIRTYMNPSVNLTINDKCYAVYLRSVGTNGASFGAISGIFQGDELLIKYAGTTYWTISRMDDSFAGPATKTGFWLMNRTGISTNEIRRNDVQLDTEAGNTVTNINAEMYLMCRNRSGTGAEVFSADNICFDWCSTGLTAAEATALHSLCEALQTSLGRGGYG